MHNTLSKGLDDRSDEELEKYHVWLALTISKYINNDMSNLKTISSSNNGDNDNDNDIDNDIDIEIEII